MLDSAPKEVNAKPTTSPCWLIRLPGCKSPPSVPRLRMVNCCSTAATEGAGDVAGGLVGWVGWSQAARPVRAQAPSTTAIRFVIGFASTCRVFNQLPRQADLRVVQRANALGPEDVARISFDLPDDRPSPSYSCTTPPSPKATRVWRPGRSWVIPRALPAWRKSARTCPPTARCGRFRPARTAPPGSPPPRRDCPAARAPRLLPARRAGPERVVPSRERRTGCAVRPSAIGLPRSGCRSW